MEKINEIELLKSTSDIYMRVCSVCGRKFYSKNKKVKYCRKCLIKKQQKNYFHYNLSNKEFKFLYERFYRVIFKMAQLFINPKHSFFELLIEQTFVSLYLQWIRMLEKGCKFNELDKLKTSTLYFFVQISYYSILRNGDLPKNLDCSCKGLSKIEKETLRLDDKKYKSFDCIDNLLDSVIDKKNDMDFLYDLKNLTKKIMLESIFDDSIKASIVRAELSDIDIKTAFITEKMKVDLINQEYNLAIKSTKELKAKAQEGIYKLYNAYAPEIKDILDLADSDFRIDTQGKEVKKFSISNPIKKCVVCGKAFLSNKPYEIVCSPNCAAIRANEKKKEKRKKDKLKELSNSVFMASSLEETKKNLSEILKLIDEIN